MSLKILAKDEDVFLVGPDRDVDETTQGILFDLETLEKRSDVKPVFVFLKFIPTLRKAKAKDQEFLENALMRLSMVEHDRLESRIDPLTLQTV